MAISMATLTINYTETPANTVSDLTNTKWVINSTTCTAGYGNFDVEVDIGPDTAYFLAIGYLNNKGTLTPTANSIAYGNTLTHANIEDIITITGGTDVTNASLISWLEANATQITVSDLTNTKWCIGYFSTYPLFTRNYNIDFTSNGYSYTSFTFDYYDGGGGEYEYLRYDYSQVYTFGFDYSSNPTWSEEAYRLIEITGGTDATNAILIAWLEENAIQVPVVDLTDTEWIFNNTIYVNSGFTANTSYSETPIFPYSLIFTDGNDEQYTALGCASSNGTLWNIFVYQLGVFTRQAYMGGWTNEAYRTISITGGTAVINPNLISWLAQNATMQTSQITVDMSSLSGWSNVSAGSHTLTIKAKATGYRDSAPSTGVSFTKAASGYTVTVENISPNSITIYDGSDIDGQNLGSVAGLSTATFTITSGYIFAFAGYQLEIIINSATGGITTANPSAVTANGAWTIHTTMPN